jgi:N-methylhydantoinase B
VVLETAGGAGYGDPLTRPPERVLDDVLDRKVSEPAARALYGVVLRADGAGFDEAATAALRASLAEDRGPITWTIDRGPDGRC